MTESKNSPCRESVLETYFVGCVYFLSGLSLIALTLLSFGCFFPSTVALGAVTCVVICAYLLRRRRFLGRITWPELGILAVLAIAIAVRSNPATYLSGGQDQGFY